MYFYIFDQLALQSKYQRVLDKISLNITDFGIEGEKVKATLTKEVPLLAKEALKKEKNRNIVVVGSDKSASQVIDVIAKSKKDVAFGFIPLKKSKIASVLGLPLEEKACRSISRRKIRRLNLGNVNKKYFLSSLSFFAKKEKSHNNPFSFFSSFLQKGEQEKITFRFQYDEHFFLTAKTSFFTVTNLFEPDEITAYKRSGFSGKRIDQHQDLLNVFIVGDRNSKNPKLDFTFFKTKWLEITTSETRDIFFDGEEQIRDKRFIVGIVPKKINVIVGSVEPV